MMIDDRESFDNQRNNHDHWIFKHWADAKASTLTEPSDLLVSGVARPALVRVLPALLNESPNKERESWLLGQVEALLRHLEIRKRTALKNWYGNFPDELHAGVLLVIAQQLARLCTQRTDVRYLNTALKILDWAKDCKNSPVDWKKSLYRYAQWECEEAFSKCDEKC